MSGPDDRRVTIKDIARELGISHATVSRALADHPGINKSTKARVGEAALRLGYVPSTAARQMRGAPSKLLGLLIPDIRNDFYATIADTLAETCAEHGYQLVLCITGDDPVVEFRNVSELYEAQVAGVILVPTRQPRPDTVTLLQRVPVVQFVRRVPRLGGDWLGIDDKGALRLATAHLAGLGHRRIGFVGGHQALSSGRRRCAGYRAAMTEAGLAVPPDLVRQGPPRPDFAREAVAALLALPDPPTALVTAGSRIAHGAIEAIEAAGVAVPDDLSFIGFGDTAWYRWWRGGATTLDLPIRAIALAAGTLLAARIGGRADGHPAGAGAFPARLLVRNSTAAPKPG